MENTTVRKDSQFTGIKVWEVIAAIIMVGLMLLTALSCASPSSATEKLEGVTWVLKSYGDAANPTMSISSHEPTLTFNKDKMTISGSSSINSFGGNYAVNGSKLTTSKIMQTLMAGAEPLMSQETAFMKILQSVQSFKVEAGQLTITGPDGILVFSQK
jgi:heat shock protein HslJ